MEVTPRRPWERLMDHCAGSAGVFTTSQAAALGIHRKTLERQVVSGTLVREAFGVYRLAGCPFDLAERARVATVQTGAVASHQTAARLWGFDGFGDEHVHVSIRHGAQRSQPNWVIVHTTRRALEPWTCMRAGVKVTGPLRTILDLSIQHVDDEQLRNYLIHCVSHRFLTVRSLERFLALKGRRLRGSVRLRQLVASLCEVDSVIEAELLELLVTAGVDRPVTQFEIRESDHFVARVDFAWPTCRVALELDGYRYHSDLRSFVSDRERGNRIVTAGWTLLRTTPAALRNNPHMIVADLSAAIRRPATAPVMPPASSAPPAA
jgi:hypothetical protein